MGEPDFFVCGLDSQPIEEFRQAYEKLPKHCDVFLTHQTWDELLPAVATNSDGSCKFITNSDIVLAGDIHVHSQQTITATDNSKFTLLSPGSTNMRAINETPEKSFFVLHEDKSISSHKFRSRPFWRSKNLYDEQEAKQLMEDVLPEQLDALEAEGAELPEAVQRPVIRIGIARSLMDEGHSLRIANIVGERAHLFWEELHREEEAIVVEKEARDKIRDAGILGGLDAVVSNKDSSLYKRLRYLLKSSNLKDAEERFSKIREKALKG
jgi:hypothetical protein